MQKPDFGNVKYRIEWTRDRIAWVRHLAKSGKSARDIARDIGLSTDQTPRIFAICKRCNIELNGGLGRSPQAATPGQTAMYRIAVQGKNAELLGTLAKRHSLYPARVLEALVNHALETGEALCENLLDLDANA